MNSRAKSSDNVAVGLREGDDLRANGGTTGRSRGVFVVGCPRSGTSVFSWTLAQHPNFWTSEESDYLTTLFGCGHLHSVYKQAYDRPDGGWLKKEGVSFFEFASKIGLGVEALFASRAGEARWIDATPGYTLMMKQLLYLFPAASFLHIVRDGRAVVSSMISSGFVADWASDFGVACRTWMHYVLQGHMAVLANPERALEVRYECLTANPQSELERVFEFLGERTCERSVEFISTRRINSSYGNVHPQDIRTAKDPAAAPKRPWEAWTAHQQGVFARIAGEAMSELGYEIDT